MRTHSKHFDERHGAKTYLLIHFNFNFIAYGLDDKSNDGYMRGGEWNSATPACMAPRLCGTRTTSTKARA
jgi:hypothetical protein